VIAIGQHLEHCIIEIGYVMSLLSINTFIQSRVVIASNNDLSDQQYRMR
jgi:hypothetical protein